MTRLDERIAAAIRAAIVDCGFGVIDVDGPVGQRSGLTAAMVELAHAFGEPVRYGKGLIEAIRPTSSATARPASLSAIYGFGEFPWHTDTAHWLQPARFLIIGCLDSGEADVPTLVLHQDGINLSPEERSIAGASPFLIANGRRSFFSTIYSKGRGFLRFDPGCMRPTDDDGAQLSNKLLTAGTETATAIRWRAGRIAIIDNWNCLHRRPNAELAARRQLLRIYAQ
jgi:hypothetical protein